MKKKYLLLCLFLSMMTYAQEEEKTDKEKIFTIVKENSVENKKKIGTFEMRKGSVWIRENDTVTSVQTKIKSINFEIDNGFIKDIIVETETGDKFTNSVSISLINFKSRFNDRLFCLNPNKSSRYIRLGDALDYNFVIGNNFTPDNITVSLPEKKQIMLTKRNMIVDTGDGRQKVKEEDISGLKAFKDTLVYSQEISFDDGITNLVDYRIYSDFLGLIESTTNGIVNFEAKVGIPINPSNFSDTNFYLFKSICPQVRYSRLDAEDRVVAIDSSALPLYDMKNKIELIQKSYLEAGFSLSVLNWNPKHSVLEFNIPFTTHFYLAEVIPGIKENVTAVSYGSGVELKVNRSKNFGVNIGGYVNRLRHLYNSKHLTEKIDPFNYFNTSAEVFFYGGKKMDALFLRFNYTSVFGDSNNFFQFQVGYKSGLNL
ncbi:hypothetical protein [Flavobacterium sp. AG291]|uniref:hypothetical protein n=1 Tax=Flavobacterium sp. AG291 TaxID=2184000 RepID=UPI000E09E73B|nr:hypothetical protein [Flavobacterium sp. AG291]RDI06968.1 hypothetical protein DEU42_11367 [Flavobacterium sp. AG291]